MPSDLMSCQEFIPAACNNHSHLSVSERRDIANQSSRPVKLKRKFLASTSFDFRHYIKLRRALSFEKLPRNWYKNYHVKFG